MMKCWNTVISKVNIGNDQPIVGKVEIIIENGEKVMH